MIDTADVLLTGDFLSIGLMMNFLSLKEMFLISLQGKPIFGVNLREKSHEHEHEHYAAAHKFDVIFYLDVSPCTQFRNMTMI